MNKLAAKLESKGVKNSNLVIVAPEDVKVAKLVGSCEYGKENILMRNRKVPPPPDGARPD